MHHRVRMSASVSAVALALLTGSAVAGQAAAPAQTSESTTGLVSAVYEHDSAGAFERRRARGLALAFYQPFRDGDVARFDKVLSRHWVNEPLNPGQGPGRDGFKPVVAGFRSVFPDLTINHQEVIVSSDAQSVTVLSAFSGTQSAEFLGVPATGRTISFRTSDVHHIRSGRIVRTRHLEDLFGAYQQLR